MAEPAQATIKEAAAFMNYSPRTVRRMVERLVLPSTGEGALLRIPWVAIHAKLARMQEGEPLWQPHPDAKPKTPPAPAAKKVRVASGQTGTDKRGTPTKTNTKKGTVIVQVRSNAPKWR